MLYIINLVLENINKHCTSVYETIIIIVYIHPAFPGILGALRIGVLPI